MPLAMHSGFVQGLVLVSVRIVVFMVIDCQGNFGLIFIDGVKVGNNQYLYELIHGKPIPRFGTLLRQVCESVGIKQPLLEKYGQAEYSQMEQEGRLITEDDSPSSMLQQVISRVVTGQQRPSYIQTLIWIKVVKNHYNNERVKKYFKNKGLEMPVFTPELEAALWTLSGYQSPDAVNKTINDFAAFDHVPRRLPRGIDITPRTDADLQIIPPRQELHTDALDARAIREI